jgi:hypothetical protein
MLVQQLLSLGVEMIDHQRDDFGSKVEAVIQVLKDKIDGGVYKSRPTVQASDEVKQIEKLIYDRIGMKIKIKVFADLPAAVIPFFSNPSNIFLHKSLQQVGVGSQQKKMKELIGQRGTVDNRKARLGGFFSDVEVMVFMDFVGLFQNVRTTVREATAFLFHELGHGFYAFEYADRLSTTNQVMAAAALAMTDNDPKNRELLYVELQKIDKKVTKDDVAKLISEHRIIAGKKLFAMVQGHVDSQLKNGAYDKIAFEQMADNFANRFGYGREIVSGLQKFRAVYGTPDTAFAVIQYSLVAYMALGAGIIAAGSFIIGGFYIVFFGGILSLLTGETARVNTYDDTKIRYKRVRNDMIDALKDREIDSDVKKVLLMQISDIDAVIDKTPIPRTILDQIANFVFTSEREAKGSMQHQQQLENLSSNELFVKSSQLA